MPALAWAMLWFLILQLAAIPAAIYMESRFSERTGK